MNDKITVSTFQLFQMIPDAESARVYLEKRLWPEGPICPFCFKLERITARRGGFYRCLTCSEDFTVRTNTIFERSHVPLHKWVYAMYLLLTSRKGISSLQLSKEIGITQKSAWFLLQRLREACGDHLHLLRGTIEIDETYIGGKESNKHMAKRTKKGKGNYGKEAVLGMRQRNGETRALPIPGKGGAKILEEIEKNVMVGSTVYTDEYKAYDGLDGYKHGAVNHSRKQYVKGDVHTNGIESVWAVLKRGIGGVYHSVSPKHLARYVNEFTFRLNEGNVKIKTLDRVESLVKATPGKRITYQKLVKAS